MNFKRFNGSTWETVRHKRYGSGTDSLTAFPAQIQAAGEPLTDYLISGKTFQDGTPSPEAPVYVIGCGIWDETQQSYKLPLTVNGTEYPIYLGRVETTRRIKKLVLTGEEELFADNGIGYVNIRDGLAQTVAPYCNILLGVDTPTSEMPDRSIKQAMLSWGAASLVIKKSPGFANSNALKSYLAAQYAAGTPVTVWYVLAEPETAVVNEPLMKIGDYADTVSYAQAGVAIPTSDGDNTISFGTTVQPSAMSAAFKGWHPVQAAKQYDGNDWS